MKGSERRPGPRGPVGRGGAVVPEDVDGARHASVADVRFRSGDDVLNLVRGLTAERTPDDSLWFPLLWHRLFFLFSVEFGFLDEDVVDDAVCFRFLGRHVIVSVGVFFDLIDGLAAVAGENLVDP